MERRYRLLYEPLPGGVPVEWVKTADELLTPNGDGSLLDFMLREADRRGTPISLQTIDSDGDYFTVVNPGEPTGLPPR